MIYLVHMIQFYFHTIYKLYFVQNSLHKESFLKLLFQTHQEQGMILSSNCIIKNKELICQPWFILDFGAPLILGDVEWRKVHLSFNHYYY
jgi:hypothetical protein